MPSVYYDSLGIWRALFHYRNDIKGSAMKVLTLGPPQTTNSLKDLPVSRNLNGPPFRLCQLLLGNMRAR